MSDATKRRIVMPPMSRALDSIIIKEPSVPELIRDALSVVNEEIIRFKHKSKEGKALALQEARVLQGYIKALVDLSKERRELADEADLANMSDTELLKLFEKLKGKVEAADE